MKQKQTLLKSLAVTRNNTVIEFKLTKQNRGFKLKTYRILPEPTVQKLIAFFGEEQCLTWLLNIFYAKLDIKFKQVEFDEEQLKQWLENTCTPCIKELQEHLAIAIRDNNFERASEIQALIDLKRREV